MKQNYKVINGVFFNETTDEKVCNILANYCGNRYQRVRVFYGDVKSGRDWCEVYDTIGYIGKSCGEIKIPLLIAKKNSWGGGAILDHCIVKITIDKMVVYKNPNYYCPIELRGNQIWNTEKNECLYNAKSEKSAQCEFDFFMGKRNSHNYKA